MNRREGEDTKALSFIRKWMFLLKSVESEVLLQAECKQLECSVRSTDDFRNFLSRIFFLELFVTVTGGAMVIALVVGDAPALVIRQMSLVYLVAAVNFISITVVSLLLFTYFHAKDGLSSNKESETKESTEREAIKVEKCVPFEYCKNNYIDVLTNAKYVLDVGVFTDAPVPFINGIIHAYLFILSHCILIRLRLKFLVSDFHLRVFFNDFSQWTRDMMRPMNYYRALDYVNMKMQIFCVFELIYLGVFSGGISSGIASILIQDANQTDKGSTLGLQNDKEVPEEGKRGRFCQSNTCMAWYSQIASLLLLLLTLYVIDAIVRKVAGRNAFGEIQNTKRSIPTVSASITEDESRIDHERVNGVVPEIVTRIGDIWGMKDTILAVYYRWLIFGSILLYALVISYRIGAIKADFMEFSLLAILKNFVMVMVPGYVVVTSVQVAVVILQTNVKNRRNGMTQHADPTEKKSSLGLQNAVVDLDCTDP